MTQPTKSKHESGAVAREEDLSPILPDGSRRRILTGDRTTGKLHLGHYIGSLKNRVRLQESYDTFILMADVQALTTHYDRPEMIKPSVMDVALDYLAAGIDPKKSTLVIQSMVPSIAELTVFYGLLVPVRSLIDNPTTKAEAQQYGYSIDEDANAEPVPDGFTGELEALAGMLAEEFTEIGEVTAPTAWAAIQAVSQNGNVSVQQELEKSDSEYDLQSFRDSAMLRREVRDELIRMKRKAGFSSMSYGFLGYPISQAADITFVGGHLVPVGPDQVPLIELCREVVHRFNAQYGVKDEAGELVDPVLVEPQALLGTTELLRGLDGSLKMGKSLGNAIYLSDSTETVWNQLRAAVTDPQRVRRTDPGRPEVCNVFSWHKVFNAEKERVIAEAGLDVPSVEETAVLCSTAGIGCVDCKKNLHAKLEALLTPMRERRAYWEARPDEVIDILKLGTRRANEEGQKTLARVKAAMHIDHFEL